MLEAMRIQIEVGRNAGRTIPLPKVGSGSTALASGQDIPERMRSLGGEGAMVKKGNSRWEGVRSQHSTVIVYISQLVSTCIRHPPRPPASSPGYAVAGGHS